MIAYRDLKRTESVTYIVYKNRVRKRAKIHRNGCGDPRMHGGTSTSTPPTGWYSEGFKTLEDPWRDASAEGWIVSLCKLCKPT